MKRHRIPALALFILLLLPVSPSLAADFTVSPIKIFFSAGKRTEAVSIKNNSPEEISLQVKVVSWTQNASGEDRYTPTEDIIAFPRIFRLKGGGVQLIRVGTKVKPGERERTYRIYIREIPGPEEEQAKGTTLRTLLRIGIPVFVAPVKTIVAGQVEDVRVAKGRLTFLVSNRGNQHFIVRAVKVEGVDASGKEVFERELAGRYLHGGHSGRFGLALPEKECQKTKHIKINVETDRISMRGGLDVAPDMCVP